MWQEERDLSLRMSIFSNQSVVKHLTYTIIICTTSKDCGDSTSEVEVPYCYCICVIILLSKITQVSLDSTMFIPNVKDYDDYVMLMLILYQLQHNVPSFLIYLLAPHTRIFISSSHSFSWVFSRDSNFGDLLDGVLCLFII